MGVRVLLIEDDRTIAEPLSEGLAHFGLAVAHVGTGTEGLRGPYGDVVLLDLGLPDMDGIDVCRGIRQASDVPIIILSARGEEADRVLGLELGADDYLAKPFSMRELVARVRAVTRRTQRGGPGGPAGPGGQFAGADAYGPGAGGAYGAPASGPAPGSYDALGPQARAAGSREPGDWSRGGEPFGGESFGGESLGGESFGDGSFGGGSFGAESFTTGPESSRSFEAGSDSTGAFDSGRSAGATGSTGSYDSPRSYDPPRSYDSTRSDDSTGSFDSNRSYDSTRSDDSTGSFDSNRSHHSSGSYDSTRAFDAPGPASGPVPGPVPDSAPPIEAAAEEPPTGPLVVDRRTRQVWVGNTPVALTPKEFELLALLTEDPGAVYSRQQILDRVWDPHYEGPTKTLDVHVATLRRKLGNAAWIQTLRGVGFRLAVHTRPPTAYPAQGRQAACR